MMLEKIQAAQAAYQRLEMTTDLMQAVIERTGQYTEGYFAMKLVADHSKVLNNGAVMATASSPEEAIDLLVQHLDNITATVQGQIDRLER